MGMGIDQEFTLGLRPRSATTAPQVSQGMILGEVEYTVWRDAEGNHVAEDAPGAVPHQVTEQVRALDDRVC